MQPSSGQNMYSRSRCQCEVNINANVNVNFCGLKGLCNHITFNPTNMGNVVQNKYEVQVDATGEVEVNQNSQVNQSI